MSPKRNDILLEEMERIRLERGGILNPRDIVDEAEPEDSVLHPYFDWDDSSASIKYRIWQARQLIAEVTIFYHDREKVPAYISIEPERHHGGGYRHIPEVMSDERLRRIALEGAHRDYEVFRMKYERLNELTPIFERAREVFQRLGLGKVL